MHRAQRLAAPTLQQEEARQTAPVPQEAGNAERLDALGLSGATPEDDGFVVPLERNPWWRCPFVLPTRGS